MMRRLAGQRSDPCLSSSFFLSGASWQESEATSCPHLASVQVSSAFPQTSFSGISWQESKAISCPYQTFVQQRSEATSLHFHKLLSAGFRGRRAERFPAPTKPSFSRGAKRRGALGAKREEVPLGCNLAEPGWITGHFRRKRNCLPEIATSACGLLAMTNRGLLPF